MRNIVIALFFDYAQRYPLRVFSEAFRHHKTQDSVPSMARSLRVIRSQAMNLSLPFPQKNPDKKRLPPNQTLLPAETQQKKEYPDTQKGDPKIPFIIWLWRFQESHTVKIQPGFSLLFSSCFFSPEPFWHSGRPASKGCPRPIHPGASCWKQSLWYAQDAAS